VLGRDVVEKHAEKDSSKLAFSSLLISDTWEVEDDTAIVKDGNEEPVLGVDGYVQHARFTVDISKIYAGLCTETELSIKLALLSEFRFLNGRLYGKPSSFKHRLLHYSCLNNACKELELRSFSQIDDSNLVDFCRVLVAPDGGVGNGSSAYRSSKAFRYSMSLLRRLHVDESVLGLPDAPSCVIREDRCLEAVKPLISSHTNYKEWLKGGSLGNVPVEIALFMLQEGLGYKESSELKSLIAIVQGVAEVSNKNRISKAKTTAQALRAFLRGNFGRDERGVYKLVRKNRQGRAFEFKLRREGLSKKFGGSVNTYDIAQAVFAKYEALGGDINSIVLPASPGECTDRVREALYRCSAMISILSGARKSEIESIRKDSFQVDKNGRATFTSKIKKTNHGAETERPVSVHAAHVAWIALSLDGRGFQHRDVRDFALLKIRVPWASEAIVGWEWQRFSLKGFYENMLGTLISDFDPEEVPLSSHRFRHTWAEIAIRRFDGNVPEAVRNHFRHWYGSFMTMDYFRNKVKADLPEINRRYMEELIHRSASGREEFFGPSGRYLLGRIRELEVLTPENIDKLLSEFDVLEVHEYSYCMMPKAQKTSAKCYDRATQTPQYDNAKWEHCGGCAGRLALSNHKEVIERIGMREQEVMASREGFGLNALNALSTKILKQCEAALDDFENHIPLVDITNTD
tara:strand:+ start:12110 stop:14173 length:2064 start_codon:yes stop_codon:yes gene_type:complete